LKARRRERGDAAAETPADEQIGPVVCGEIGNVVRGVVDQCCFDGLSLRP
jgi:hypothetical protein